MGTNEGGVVYDYGRCPCTGAYEGRFIEVEMEVSGRQVVVTSIPQGECPGCGSQVYKLQIIERMETLMRPEKG
ncbi:hypothetical protein LZ198_09820 [Myxococcus sp. K15C18031901]|uniref:hypothetical protein n=1 Tax=Myxococcus dinghuensis TaxID=2906761 RepID=UPI0020A71A5D|nr:hypothetical protein [Myxococcus dinghuensis]MCP3099165.1 hypothetical protein [Myxococcus dinghuensis]